MPDGHVPFLVAHAVGTQGYFCLSSGASSAWVPFGPQATLFNEELGQVMTHFLSPNPDQGVGTARDVAGFARHECDLGGAGHSVVRFELRRTWRDPLAATDGRRRGIRANRRRPPDRGDLHSSCEYDRRDRAHHAVQRDGEAGTGAVRSGLLLLSCVRTAVTVQCLERICGETPVGVRRRIFVTAPESKAGEGWAMPTFSAGQIGCELRSIGEIADHEQRDVCRALFERLWWHDQVVFDG